MSVIVRSAYNVCVDMHGNILTDYLDFNFEPIINLDIPLNKKVLIANLLDKNIMVTKTKITIDDKQFWQYFCENWKLSNNIKAISLPKKITQDDSKDLADCEIYNAFEQEVIYSLLSGYTVDKKLEEFITVNTKSQLKGNIRYVIAILFERFNCNNRNTLIEILREYELDRLLPISLFPPGIYEVL